MSTFGTKTKTFLSISLSSERTCEDYTKPSRPTYKLCVNGAELSVWFWWAPMKSWRPSFDGWRKGFTWSTPLFYLDFYPEDAFLMQTRIDGDYPGPEHEARIAELD